MTDSDPLSFAIRVRSDLLVDYGKYHNIGLPKQKKGQSGEDYAEAILAKLDKEPSTKQAKFNSGLEDIDAISSTKGCEYLLNRASSEDLQFNNEEYDKLGNMKERAMYFFLKYADLFDQASEMFDLQNKQGWCGRRTTTMQSTKYNQHIPDLEKALQQLYRKESRGKNLKVKIIVKEEKIIFIAYVEDILTTDLEFKNKKLESEIPRRPVLTIYFRYYAKTGVLDVKAKGGTARVEELQNLFIETYLKSDPAKHKRNIRYDFEKIKQLDKLNLKWKTSDRIESVTLKGLKLIHNENHRNLSVDIKTDPNKNGMYSMKEHLKAMNINLKEHEVRKFKLQFIFKKVGNSNRQKKLTVAITYPNRCDLKDGPHDEIVRRLLKEWEFDLI